MWLHGNLFKVSLIMQVSLYKPSTRSVLLLIIGNYSTGDKLSQISHLCYKSRAWQQSKEQNFKIVQSILFVAEQAARFDVKRRMSLMATPVGMCESDKVFAMYSVIYVHMNLCGWKRVSTLALISEFTISFFLSACLCVYVRVYTCSCWCVLE